MPSAIKTLRNITSGNNIFSRHCSREWFPFINLHEKILEYETGERIIHEGEKVKGIFLIQKGKVKVVSAFGKNEERILRLAGTGKLLGHRGLGAKTYPMSAIALTPVTLSFIPVDIFYTLFRANPELSIAMINFMAAELSGSESRMKKMIHLDVRRRIADIIIMLVDAFGYDKNNKLNYTLSRNDVANIAGTTYESVIRSLTFLKEQGYIRLDGKAIIVSDLTGLKAFAHG